MLRSLVRVKKTRKISLDWLNAGSSCFGASTTDEVLRVLHAAFTTLFSSSPHCAQQRVRATTAHIVIIIWDYG